MSNRKTILEAINTLVVATTDMLADSVPNWPRKKIQDTVSDCYQNGLVSRDRDDVTGMPCYSLTKEGKAWLNEKQPNSKKQNTVEVVCDTQAGSGESNPGSHASGPLVEQRQSPPGGVANVEQPKQDDEPAEACSGEIQEPEYDPDEVSFNPSACAMALRVRAEKAEAQRDTWRKLGSLYGCETPLALGGFIVEMKADIDALADKIRHHAQIATAATQNRDDLKKVLDSVYVDRDNLLKTLNEVVAEKDRLQAELAQKTPSTVKYAVAFQSDFHDSIDSAISQAQNDFDIESIGNVFIVTTQTIGRVEIKPVFVPLQPVA